MKEIESTPVLRTNVARAGLPGDSPGGLPIQNKELPHSLKGECGSCLGIFGIGPKGGVDSVNTFGFGLGRTSAGLARIRHVFWSFLVFPRAGMRFESHLGHDVFPRQRRFCCDVLT